MRLKEVARFYNMEQAFIQRLQSIKNHPYINYENQPDDEKKDREPWWRPTNLPVRTERISTSNQLMFQGFYQIDVFVPAKENLKVMLQYLDDLATAFNTNESLYYENTSVEITDVTRGQFTQDGKWLKGFIQIYYKCYSE